MTAKTKLTPEQVEATVSKAVAIRPPSVQRRKVNWPRTNAKGAPVENSMINARMAIQQLKLSCSYDLFHGVYVVNGTNLQTLVGELSDKVTRKVRELSFVHLGFEPTLTAMNDGILRACEQHMYNPIVDYLDALSPHDGVNRMDTWLTKYVGAADTPLHREWGRLILMNAIKRAREPGSKFDHVLVLEGPEGIRKSSLIKVLANGKFDGTENYSDSSVLGEREREQQQLTKGVWFYELGELAGMKRADQFAVKNFITKQNEVARAAYAHFVEAQPRTSIFIGTFNTTAESELIEYLNQGDRRRWWPLLCGKIDIEALTRDRDQLFAEADAAIKAGAVLYLRDEFKEAATEIQMTREMSDPLADILSTLHLDVAERWNGGRGKAMMAAESAGDTYLENTVIADGVISVSAKYVLSKLEGSLKNNNGRITAAMRNIGWRAFRDRRLGYVARGYEHDVGDAPAEDVKGNPWD